MQRIPWREFGRLTTDRVTHYDALISEPQRLLFLGLLLATRGARATAVTSCHYCFVRRKTVEVDWAGFAEALASPRRRPK